MRELQTENILALLCCILYKDEAGNYQTVEQALDKFHSRESIYYNFTTEQEMEPTFIKLQKHMSYKGIAEL